jgi:hypothetical protein
MAVLVGIYLLHSDSIEVERNGKTSWLGSWALFRSPSCDGCDWELLTSGKTSQLFTSIVNACEAGQSEGVVFARMLQADDCLEPMVWPSDISVELQLASQPFYDQAPLAKRAGTRFDR